MKFTKVTKLTKTSHRSSTHPGLEIRDCRVALGCAGGARECARRGERPDDHKRNNRITPLVTAPRFVISNRRAPWTAGWYQMDPRCLGASVCRGQREERASADPLNGYLGSWTLGVDSVVDVIHAAMQSLDQPSLPGAPGSSIRAPRMRREPLWRPCRSTDRRVRPGSVVTAVDG